MTETRDMLVRRIAQARRSSEQLWSAVTGAQQAGKDKSAEYRQDFEQAQRADAYLSDLEAVLGDYDRTHPYEGDDVAFEAEDVAMGTETIMGTETMTEVFPMTETIQR